MIEPQALSRSPKIANRNESIAQSTSETRRSCESGQVEYLGLDIAGSSPYFFFFICMKNYCTPYEHNIVVYP